MAQNFLACDRDQELLLPPSLREWLPEEHFAWFVIDAVSELDLSAFFASYRVDGHGRAAHDPAMMVALLLYAYAIGERSSRRIERRCVEDVATRVICANQAPDHTTIARFRQRHERALAELFGDVLALCAESGLVRVGVIAVDGTKVHANAAPQATRDYEQIAREILEEADAVDAEEDERFGDARGDELPAEFSTAQGRRGWLREAKRRLDERRAEEARPIPKSRRDRPREAKRRLEEEHQVECQANAGYEAYRARGVMTDGRRFGRPPDPFEPPLAPSGKINLSDLDSRNVKTSRGWVQGYNAQLVTTEDQIVIAAEVNVDSPDFGHLEPMVAAARRELERAGVDASPEVVLARRTTGRSRPSSDRRRLLAPHPDGAPRLRRDGRLGPARRQEARRITPGLGRRALRVHAARPGHRARRRPLRQAPGDGRAGVRRHQVQPRHRPIPPPRQGRRQIRMAPDRNNLAQALIRPGEDAQAIARCSVRRDSSRPVPASNVRAPFGPSPMRTAPSSAACSRTQSSLTPSMRIHEALAINEPDLDHRRGALLVRRGKGGRRREVGMDEWAWEHLQPWLDVRLAECRAALLGFIGMRGYGFDSGPPHPAVTEGPEPRWPRHPPRSIGSRPRPPCRVDVPPVHVPAMGLGGAPEALLVWVGGWVGAITTAANDDRPDAFLYDLMITAARLAGQQVVDRLLGAERPPDPSKLAVLERATADYEAYRRAGGFVMRFPNPDGTVVEVPFASPPGAGV